MALESGTFISDLVSTNPVGTDTVDKADDHIRLIKSTLKTTFPSITGAVTPTHTELNHVSGATSNLQSQINLRAPLASPGFTGIPAAPTAAVDTATTQLATTAYVVNQGYLKSTTAAFTYATTSSLSSYATTASLSSYATTASLSSYATTASLANYAPLVSPALSGTPTAPTAGGGTNNTQIATTAFVQGAVAGTVQSGFELLGTLTPAGNASQSLTGLNLSRYSSIAVYANGISGTNGAATNFLINGTIFTATGSAGGAVSKLLYVELLLGYSSLLVPIAGITSGDIGTGVACNVTSGTTTITFSVHTGTFDAGSISVYGVK